MSLGIPSGGGYDWRTVTPITPVARPRALGENVEADSQDTRARAEEARRAAARRRNDVGTHQIVPEAASDAGTTEKRELPPLTARELFVGLAVLGAVILGVVLLCIPWH